jgi:hypothetical protein
MALIWCVCVCVCVGFFVGLVGPSGRCAYEPFDAVCGHLRVWEGLWVRVYGSAQSVDGAQQDGGDGPEVWRGQQDGRVRVCGTSQKNYFWREI